MVKKQADAYIARAAAKMLEEFAVAKNLTMADIAARGDISPPALSQIKHQRRNLTADLGIKLAKSLEMKLESFYLDLARHALLIHEEEKRNDGEVFFAGDDYQDGISALLTSLEKADTYWLISIEKPIEFGGNRLDDVLLECVEKGCSINYVFPPLKYDDLLDDEVLEEDDSVFILEEHGDADLDKRFAVWKKRFMKRYPDKEDAIQGCFQCFHAPFSGDVWFAPFVKYILIERSTGAEHDEAWLDVAYYDPLSTRAQERCVLPLDPSVVKDLKVWCRSSTEKVSD